MYLPFIICKVKKTNICIFCNINYFITGHCGPLTRYMPIDVLHLTDSIIATQNQSNDRTDDDLLAELSRAKITEYTPVIAYVAAVILLGIIGNIMTVIFYGFKTLRHTIALHKTIGRDG